MKRKSRVLALVSLVLVLAVLTTGFSCSNWERTSYQSLAASKAVIDAAAADYNSGALPQNAVTKSAIEKAQDAQRVAVNAFWAYEEAKLASAGDTDAKKKVFEDALARIPEIVALVKSLYPQH